VKQFPAIFCAIFFLLSCQNKSGSEWHTVTYIQDKPYLTHLNLGDSLHGHGDGMAYEAPIRDTAGNVVGEILGWIVSVDIMDGDSSASINIIDRIGTAVLNFGDENEIMVQGGNTYMHGETIMKVGVPQKRAIVGGTGKYKGVEGELTTTRNADSTYTQTLDMKLEN
jgi:hypothetical protein